MDKLAHLSAPEPGVSRLRRLLRRIARAILWRLRPVAAPLFRRLRSALLAGLQEDLARTRRELGEQIRSGGNIGQSAHEQRDLIAGLHQAIQASREALREEVLMQTSDLGNPLLRDLSVRLAHVEHLLQAGTRHAGLHRFIEKFLRPGDTFVDTHAQAGQALCAAARGMHGEGTIFAFEPALRLRPILEHTVQSSALQHMVSLHDLSISDGTPIAGETLDGLLPAGQPVTLLGIDTRQASPAVLHGARSLLDSNPAIGLLLELEAALPQRAAWLSALSDLGFTGRGIDAVTGVLQQGGNSNLLLFARPASCAWQRAEGIR